MIGSDIRIQILSSEKNQVRIGIEAPKEIPVRREEIVEKTKLETSSV